MLKTILIGTLIIACASIAAAQSSEYKRWEVFGGFSHNRFDVNTSPSDPSVFSTVGEYEGFNGFNASVTGNVSRYVGFKFDVSGHYHSNTVNIFNVENGVTFSAQIYNFLGGVQVKDNASEKTFKPFAHALAGAAHARNRIHVDQQVCIAIAPNPCPDDFTASETKFAGAFGGGLDIRAGNKLDIRVVQIDYNPTRLYDSSQRNVRIGVGFVFH